MGAGMLKSALLSILLVAPIALTSPARVLGQEGPQSRAVDVAVANHTDAPTQVYVIQNGHMVPMGLVGGMANETLRLPRFLVGSAEPIRLVADLIGTERWHESDPVSVQRPTMLEFTIDRNLARSTVVSR